MSMHVIVVGCGRVGSSLALDIAADGLELREPSTAPGERDDTLQHLHPSGGIGPLRDASFGEQPTTHLLDGPRRRRDGGNPEALIDLGAPRVVDARDDGRDLERLACDASGEDVRVVAARHRRQCVGPAGAGGVEVVAVTRGGVAQLGAGDLVGQQGDVLHLAVSVTEIAGLLAMLGEDHQLGQQEPAVPVDETAPAR